MPNIYELTTEFVSIYDALIASADDETGEVSVDLVAALNDVQMKFEEKAIATAVVYRMIDEESKRAEAAIKRLTAYKKRLDTERDRVKNTLSDACIATGTEKLRGIYASISFRRSEQTVIDNVDALPAEFIKQKVEYQPDKTAIKEAIKGGRDVPGAHLETVNNIQIK